MKKRGRPTKFKFDRFLFDHICLLTLSGLTLKKISMMDDMPPSNVLYFWTKKYPCLRKIIALCKINRKDFEVEKELERRLSLISF